LIVVAVTKGGQTLRGIALNDDLSIQIRDSDGNPRSFLKDDLKSLRRERRSVMPSYAGRLTAAEIGDLVSYLRTLRGPPPKIGPRTRQPHHAYSSIEFLDRIGRDAEERPDTPITALEIPAGATVAELGSGTGYYTRRLARVVRPGGKVFAVDVQQAMLDRTAETIRKHQLDNIELVLGDETSPHLATGALDLVFIAHAYHVSNRGLTRSSRLPSIRRSSSKSIAFPKRSSSFLGIRSGDFDTTFWATTCNITSKAIFRFHSMGQIHEIGDLERNGGTFPI